jgi:hypothetical protein
MGFDAGMPPESDSDAVRACMQQIGCTLAIARRLIEGGKQVDLAGLDSQMGFVCAVRRTDGARTARVLNVSSPPRQKAAPCSPDFPH